MLSYVEQSLYYSLTWVVLGLVSSLGFCIRERGNKYHGKFLLCELVTPQRRDVSQIISWCPLSPSHMISPSKKIRLLRKTMEQVRRPMEVRDFLLATWILPKEGSYFISPLWEALHHSSSFLLGF